MTLPKGLRTRDSLVTLPQRLSHRGAWTTEVNSVNTTMAEFRALIRFLLALHSSLHISSRRIGRVRQQQPRGESSPSHCTGCNLAQCLELSSCCSPEWLSFGVCAWLSTTTSTYLVLFHTRTRWYEQSNDSWTWSQCSLCWRLRATWRPCALPQTC